MIKNDGRVMAIIRLIAHLSFGNLCGFVFFVVTLKQAIQEQPHLPHLGPMIETLDWRHMHR